MKRLFNKLKSIVSFNKKPAIYIDPALSAAYVTPVSPPSIPKIKKIKELNFRLLGRNVTLALKRESTPTIKKIEVLKEVKAKKQLSFKNILPRKSDFSFPKISKLDLTCIGVLVAIIAILVIKNYSQGTFLTGWDTLHPEFNLSIAFKRALFGVWRSDQGLGAIAAHSHMSELPRLVFLAIAKLFLPISQLRYAFFFACLLIAPIGMFTFLKTVIPSKNKQIQSLSSFLGAVAYLLNLTVLQHFYVPFEMFATQLAALPLLMLFVFKYLGSGKKRSALAFFAVSLLATPQAYAATLFYAWAFFLGLFLISFTLAKQFRFVYVKRALFIAVLMLASNAFWILPNIYSVRNQSTEISESSVNQLFTPEAYLHNVGYGQTENVAIGKSYLLDWKEYDSKSSKFVDLFDEWNIHLQNPYVNSILYGIVIISLLGLVLAIFKRDLFIIASIPSLLMTLFFLLTENGPLGGLFTWVHNNLNLFEEALRNPFTKFSTLFLFLSSVLFAYGVSAVMRLNRDNLISKLTRLAMTVIFALAIIISVRPMFEGSLISPSMRQVMPSEYMELFSWFQARPGRIAKFPINSLWGWEYNNWGYQGAGFMWFGLENPVLMRDFDRWSANNETFYLEAREALYNGNPDVLDKVFQKYNVEYIVLDESIVNAGGDEAILYNKELKTALASLPHISLEFETSFLKVYKTGHGGFSLSSPEKLTADQTDMTYASTDSLYQKKGIYVNTLGGVESPFLNITSRTGVTVQRDQTNLVFTKQLSDTSRGEVLIPNILETEANIPVQVSAVQIGNDVTVSLAVATPKVMLDGVPVENKPLSVSFTAKAPQGGVSFISVGKSMFDVRGKTLQGDPIGSTTISRDTNVQIGMHAQSIATSFGSEISARVASLCRSDEEKVKTNVLLNGFEVELDTDAVCLGSGVTLAKSSILEVSYKTKNLSSPFFCVNQEGVSGCVNDETTKVKTNFGSKTYTNKAALSSGSYWLVFVASSQGNKTTASYSDISAQVYPAFFESTFSPKVAFSGFSTAQTVTLEEGGSTMSVTLPIANQVSEDFTLGRGQSKAYNCDLDRVGSVYKKLSASTVTYKAENGGVSCDYFDYPNLTQKQSYLLWNRGINSAGRSIKYYLYNMARARNEAEVLLGSGEFDQWTAVPATGSELGGYVVNLETRAFGSVAGINELSELSFIPYPANWLAGVQIVHSEDNTITSDLTINEVKAVGTFYKISTSGKGVLVLNEAYESGWVAFSGNRLTHLKLNSWQNAWEVPDGNNMIYIFYMPQLLEWGGLTFILIAFIVLLKHKGISD